MTVTFISDSRAWALGVFSHDGPFCAFASFRNLHDALLLLRWVNGGTTYLPASIREQIESEDYRPDQIIDVVEVE